MLGAETSELRSQSRAALSITAAVAGLILGACMPREDLEGYSRGSELSVALDAEEPVDDTTAALDAGAPLSSSLDSGVSAAPGVDSGADAAQPLACPADCACEARDGQTFILCTALESALGAAQRCEAEGAALVSIEDGGLQAWLEERMAALEATDFWSGGSDFAEEGVWRWSDGRVYDEPAGDAAPASFLAWGMGQPNGVRMENCMRVVGAEWRDRNCADPAAFACER